MRTTLRILVVEDDQDLELALTANLQRVDPDCVVDWATSGEEALERLRCAGPRGRITRYDLVITDVLLAGKVSGLDVWAACESGEPRIPCMMMTGLSVEEFFTMLGNNTPAPQYLPKPFTRSDFRKAVQNLLDRGGREGGVA